MNASDVLLWIRGHKASTAGLVLVVAGCLALVGLFAQVLHGGLSVAEVGILVAMLAMFGGMVGDRF